MLAAVLVGLAIGLLLGTVGGGGAVLAVPALVYAVGLGVHEATTASLAVVAAGAATGALGQARRGTVCWPAAGWFALSAAAGSALGALANRALSGAVLLLIFGAVVLLVAGATWQRAGSGSYVSGGCPDVAARTLIPFGVGIGALTGLVGVGGGFLVVPALAIGLSFGIREAMATSMVVVTIASLTGLASHLAIGHHLDVPVVAVMGAATVCGAALAPRLADRIPTKRLARSLAVLLVVVALGTVVATLAGVGV